MASQKSSRAAPVADYDRDVMAWAEQQAQFLRAGRFDLLDIADIADEIEDVGKSEKRELGRRMAVLLAHLLKWQAQPAFRGESWEPTIREQRKAIALHPDEVPSLKAILHDRRWRGGVWADAVSKAAQETGLAAFPEVCPWDLMAEVLAEGWLPERGPRQL